MNLAWLSPSQDSALFFPGIAMAKLLGQDPQRGWLAVMLFRSLADASEATRALRMNNDHGTKKAQCVCCCSRCGLPPSDDAIGCDTALTAAICDEYQLCTYPPTPWPSALLHLSYCDLVMALPQAAAAFLWVRIVLAM